MPVTLEVVETYFREPLPNWHFRGQLPDGIWLAERSAYGKWKALEVGAFELEDFLRRVYKLEVALRELDNEVEEL